MSFPVIIIFLVLCLWFVICLPLLELYYLESKLESYLYVSNDTPTKFKNGYFIIKE